MVRLARRERVHVVPGVREERLRLLDRSLAQGVVVAGRLGLGGADRADRDLLLSVCESENRNRVIGAMLRLGHDGEARAERMAQPDHRYRLEPAAAKLLGSFCQPCPHLRDE